MKFFLKISELRFFLKKSQTQYLQGIEKILDLYFKIRYKSGRFVRGIAQLVEHRSPKPGVVSSNLTAPAIFSLTH